MKILITDGNYPHSLGIVRSLSSLGHNVDVIGNNICISSLSRYLSKCAYNKSLFNQENIDNFIKFLNVEKYDFLIPIGAESVNLISKNRKLISKESTINLASQKSIFICLNKSKTLDFAKKRNILIPKEFSKDFVNEYLDKKNKLPSKMILKPAFELSNNKVKYIFSKKDYFENIKNISEEFILQEYIDGYGIGFFAIYDKGHIKNFFMHRRIREYPLTGGSSVLAKSIYNKRAFNNGKRLLDDLKWHGVAMVEFKKDKYNGKLYLMEINPKFWGSHDLAIYSGINFAEEYLSIYPDKRSSNLIIKPKINYKLDKKFQWPSKDFISCHKKPIKLILSIFDFLNPSINNNIFLRDPLASIFLIIYDFLRPIYNTIFTQEIIKFISRIKNAGLKIALIRSFTEISGIPLLKYSQVTNQIALGMQPKYFGYFYLKYSGFNYILNLRKYTKENNKNKSFKILNLAVEEYKIPTIKQLNKGADFINNVVINNNKIYIHCREGISRAPLFLIAYFIKYKSYSLNKSLKKISNKRKFINILPNQIKILENFELLQFKNIDLK